MNKIIYEEKLNKLFNECIKELKSIGIDTNTLIVGNLYIEIATRKCKRYGCCKNSDPDLSSKYYYKIGRKKYLKYSIYKKHNIEISKWVMELDDNTIKNTIIHELIHAFPECDNHGQNFKKYANYINEKLNYNIARVGNKNEDLIKNNKEIEKEKYNYKIVCKDCGYTFYRKRLDKYFKLKYRCGKCKRKIYYRKR